MLHNPYEFFGVSSSATEKEVVEAYKRIGREITLSEEPEDIKTQKMNELDNAYDSIINELRGTSSYSSGTNQQTHNYNDSQFEDIRQRINSGRIEDAEMLLNGIPQQMRNAEWYYLKGVIHQRRGWLNEAYNCFQNACSMDPSNQEYAAAYNALNNNARGGYRASRKSGGGGICALCSGLICANLCCECCCKD